jgi:hypothetical protein
MLQRIAELQLECVYCATPPKSALFDELLTCRAGAREDEVALAFSVSVYK